MAIGKKQGMSSIKSLYDSDGVFECPIAAQNVSDRISHHIKNLDLPNSRHYVKKQGDGFIIYFVGHARQHVPLSGAYLNSFLNGISTMKKAQDKSNQKPIPRAQVKEVKSSTSTFNPNELKFSEIDELCCEFKSVKTDRYGTQRNQFKYQSQYKTDVIKIIQWALKMGEPKIVFSKGEGV